MPGMTTSTIKRQPKGTPVGGEFAAHDRSESTLSLSPYAQRAAQFPDGTNGAMPEYWEAIDEAQGVIDADAPDGLDEDALTGWTSVKPFEIAETQQPLSYLAYEVQRNLDLAENDVAPYRTHDDPAVQARLDRQWVARAARLREVKAALEAAGEKVKVASEARHGAAGTLPVRPQPVIVEDATIGGRYEGGDNRAARDQFIADSVAGFMGTHEIDQAKPANAREVKNALNDSDGKLSPGKIRHVVLTHETLSAGAGKRASDRLDIHPPLDGTPMWVAVQSGLPRLHINSGRAVIHPDSSWGNSITVGGDAEVLIVSSGKKVGVTVEGNAKVTIIDPQDDREPMVFMQGDNAQVTVNRLPKASRLGR